MEQIHRCRQTSQSLKRNQSRRKQRRDSIRLLPTRLGSYVSVQYTLPQTYRDTYPPMQPATR